MGGLELSASSHSTELLGREARLEAKFSCNDLITQADGIKLIKTLEQWDSVSCQVDEHTRCAGRAAHPDRE